MGMMRVTGANPTACVTVMVEADRQRDVEGGVPVDASPVFRHSRRMSAALFAIAGTIIGIAGSILTTLVRARHEEHRIWREALRSVCANFTTEIIHLRGLSNQLRDAPDDEELQRAAHETHSRARSLQEQLRITSKSKEAQEAGRWLIHNAYWLWRSTQGDARADFLEARASLDGWLPKFYKEVRKELGLGTSDVYEDPQGGLPIPAAKDDDRALCHRGQQHRTYCGLPVAAVLHRGAALRAASNSPRSRTPAY